MSSTTLLTDAPQYTQAVTGPFLTFDSTATAAWKLVDTVEIFLLGVPTDSAEPRKSLTDWYTANRSSISQFGLNATLAVSSWAIVVDVKWKAAFAPVRLINTTNDNLTPPSGLANENHQAIGSTGDTIALYLSVKDQTYTQPAIRIAQTVTTRG